MYQSRPSARDRAATFALVLAIHAGLAVALFTLSGGARDVLPEEVAQMFDVSVPPPPPVVEILPEPEKTRPKEEEAPASPENIKSKATPVTAPKPPIALPIPQPMPAAPTPDSGSDSTTGAGTAPGSGTGSGGQGTGSGSGGSGSGTGGGGGGGTAVGVKLVRGITARDYPPAIRQSWPRGGRIFTRIRVQPDGRISQCDVMRSFGDRLADQWTCSLILERGVFRPATDASGKPVAAWFGYVQSDSGPR